MKVLLINGSPRANGNTFTALSEVARTLNEEGIETEIISIGKQAVQGCIACGMCGREGKCTFRDELYFKMKADGVLGRRYFYPLISTFSTYRSLPSAGAENLPVATKVANEVICLPMHHELTDTDIERVLNHIVNH